jgi:hypothetical protein
MVGSTTDEDGVFSAALLALTDGGWAALLPDLRYKLNGTPAGEFWYAAGRCRFEPGELDRYVPALCRLRTAARSAPSDLDGLTAAR